MMYNSLTTIFSSNYMYWDKCIEIKGPEYYGMEIWKELCARDPLSFIQNRTCRDSALRSGKVFTAYGSPAMLLAHWLIAV